MIPMLIGYKNKWSNNYWDDGGLKTRISIRGSWHFFIRIFPSPMEIPIGAIAIF